MLRHTSLTPIALAVGLMLMPMSSYADDASRIKELEAKLEQAVKAVEALKQRVDQMTGAAPAAAPAPVVAAAENTARIEAVEKAITDFTAAASRPVDNGLPLHGFADIGWAQRSNVNSSAQSGFRLGTFDIYLTPQLSPRVKGLIELAFEYAEDGSLGTDLERLQVGYLFSDALTVWGGRFHTPYGYWNTAFHHGAQIQTSITRPRFVAFEDQGGIVPGHTVGAWGTGSVNTSAGKVNYDAYVGNGNHINAGVLDYQASGDDNSSPAAGFRLGLSPSAVPGLTVGLHGLRQKVSGTDAAAAKSGASRMQFFGGYGFFESDRWEVIGEVYKFNNKDLTGGNGAQSSWAAYGQAAYNVVDRWNVFGRWEKTSLSQLDPYFALQESGRSYHQWTGGLRYDLDPRSALKLQLDRNQDDSPGGAGVTWVRAQYAVRF